MGQSLKAIVQLGVIVAVIAAIFFWVVPQRPNELVWAGRIISPLFAGVLVWLLLRQSLRKERLPDLLRQIAGAVDEEISCSGGAFKVRRIPYSMGQDMGGRTARYDVLASASYPEGRGNLLRHRQGVRVGSILGDKTRLGCGAALLFVGVISISRPARLNLKLPSNTVDAPDDLPGEDEVLWEPDLPTGGFPVVVPGGDEGRTE